MTFLKENRTPSRRRLYGDVSAATRHQAGDRWARRVPTRRRSKRRIIRWNTVLLSMAPGGKNEFWVSPCPVRYAVNPCWCFEQAVSLERI